MLVKFALLCEENSLCQIHKLAYRMGVRNLPQGMSALAFTRIQLDRLGLGAELTHLPWSGKRYKLPPSTLAPPVE